MITHAQILRVEIHPDTPGTRELFESWLDLTSTNGLDLLPTGPTFKSFGKHQGGCHYVSTLDQLYVSETIPARAYLLPDAVTDYFPVVADLQVGGRKRTCPGDCDKAQPGLDRPGGV